MNTPTFQKIMIEQEQLHETRKSLYEAVEKEFGVPIVSFFTTYSFPGVMIDDGDANMLETILRTIDLSKGFGLIISSPGGGRGLLPNELLIYVVSIAAQENILLLCPKKQSRRQL